MKLKTMLLAAVAAAGLSLAAAQSASAATAYAFGFSGYDGGETLTLGTGGGGSVVLNTNKFQGWVSDAASNFPVGGPDGNTNYIVGDLSGVHYNDYFVFDISGLHPGVHSATLTVNPYTITNNFTYRLGAASSLVGQLHDAVSPNAALYAALGSGHSYGSFSLTPGQSNGPPLSFTLTSGAIGDLNSAIAHGDQYFAVGGTVTPGGVPEPASWALMLAGFGALGATLRASKRQAAAA